MASDLNRLPAVNLLAVVQKLTPVSFIRLRQTTKSINDFCEENSNQIGIHIPWEICLAPRCAGIFKNRSPELFDKINNGEYIEWPTVESVNLKVFDVNRPDQLSLAKAANIFACFRFRKISFRFKTELIDDVRVDLTTLMAPEVQEIYYNLIKSLKISCDYLYFDMDTVPRRLLEEFKPKTAILDWWAPSNFLQEARIPVTTKTIIYEHGVYTFNDIGLIPRHVENVGISGVSSTRPAMTVMLQMTREIITLWYSGSLTFKRLQRIILATVPQDSDFYSPDIAGKYLKDCLEGTPYEIDENELQDCSWVKEDTMVTVAQIPLKNQFEAVGMLSIRFDIMKTERENDRRKFNLSMYFYNYAQEFPKPTEEYYVLEYPGFREKVYSMSIWHTREEELRLYNRREEEGAE